MIRRKSRQSGSDDFLPEAELEVLAVLHETGEREASAIRDALARYRNLTHASVATLLRRLEERGLVSRRKGDSGKAFLYSATRKASGTQRGVIERTLERVFRGRPVSLVASLFEVRTPDEKEIEELRSLLDTIEKKRAKR